MSEITAKEIARILGISPASVSFALNGKPGVSEATRAKIKKLAQELGYTPAKVVRPQENPMICFLIYTDEKVAIAQESTFYTFVLKGVEAAAKELGYRVMIRYLEAGADFFRQMEDVLPDLAGVILLGTDITTPRKGEITSFAGKNVGFPMVIVDNFIFSAYVDCVGNDNLYGAKSAISYLIDRGHRRIGYLRANQRITNFDDREAGIRMAIAEHLGNGPQVLETIGVSVSAEGAYRDVCRWLERTSHLPDALFGENDVIAAAAIRALKMKGIRVPEDISVMGFDDIPVCEMVEPTITTVHSFKESLGREAVGLLHRRILAGQNGETAQASGVIKLSLSTRIVERQSVANK